MQVGRCGEVCQAWRWRARDTSKDMFAVAGTNLLYSKRKAQQAQACKYENQ